MAPLYLALLHFPVYDKNGQVVTTAVTHMDIHDIARSARTFGLKGYFVVSPIEAQRALVESLLSHWDEGPGRRRMPDRSDALERVKVCESLAAARDQIGAAEGRAPFVVATTARRVPSLSAPSTSSRSSRASEP